MLSLVVVVIVDEALLEMLASDCRVVHTVDSLTVVVAYDMETAVDVAAATGDLKMLADFPVIKQILLGKH